MNKIIFVVQLHVVIVLASLVQSKEDNQFSLTVIVNDLRNSDGVVQFALYNNEGSIPDEHYEKYYRKCTAKIANGASEICFENLPKGKYAVNILHDENNNRKIDKGLFLPIEGIGFSNFQTINIINRPAFSKASFSIDRDKKIKIKMIYF